MLNIKFSTQPVFTGVPAEVALAMFEELMTQQELIERGEKCDKCGKLHFPEDLCLGLCSDCLVEIALETAKEIEQEIALAEAISSFEEEIEDFLMEIEEEKGLEERALFEKIVALLSDDTPIDIRMY